MRLHLIIQRHGLPVTRILWTTSSSARPYASPSLNAQPAPSASAVVSTRTPNAAFSSHGGYTIAQLLEDVNEVVPLETEPAVFNDETTGQWGLEDYVVEVAGSECLHFMDVEGLLRDGDEVVIRALQTADLRARRLSGRHQISMDGKHLIDGVPFGRPFLKRTSSSRPAIAIPPRKRRRTLVSGWTAGPEYVEEDTEWAMPPPPPPHHGISGDFDGNVDGTVIRHPLPADEDSDEDQSDSEEADVADFEELADELDDLKEDLDAAGYAVDHGEQQRHSGYSLRRRNPKYAGKKDHAGRPSSALVSINDDSPKRESSRRSSKLVRFEQATGKSMGLAVSAEDRDGPRYAGRQTAVSEGPKEGTRITPQPEDLDKSDTEKSPSSESEASISSSDEDSDSESEQEESTSESEMDEIPDTVTTTRPRPKVNPPGQGSAQTKKSNRRNKLKRRLSKLKELGALPPEADFAALRAWEERHGDQLYVPITSKVANEAHTAKAQPAANASPKSERPSNGDKSAAAVGDNKILTPKEKERAKFEAKRQQLLRELASGGVDVSEYVDKENVPPLEDVVVGQPDVASTQVDLQPKEKAVPADMPGASKPLDVAGSQRLEENGRPLAGDIDSAMLQGPADVAPKEAEKDEAEVNWQDRLIVKATECVFDDIELSAPPFPFQQRWDSNACETIRRRKGWGQGRKRKRQEWYQYYDGQADVEDEDENGDDNYFQGDGELDYDDAEASEHDETVSKVPTENMVDGADDLPPLPADLGSLQDLSEDDVAVGTVIAFKALDMSKATNWQPRVSAYKVAAVTSVNGDLIQVQLAKRDRRPRPEPNGDEEGARSYSGFEMPGFDDDEEDDEGYREMTFDSFIAPKLLRAPARSDAGQREEASQKSIVSVEVKNMGKDSKAGRSDRTHKSLSQNEEVHVPSTPEPVIPDDDGPAPESPESIGDADATLLAVSEDQQDGCQRSPTVQSPKFSGFSPLPNLTPTRKRRRNTEPVDSDPVSIEVSISCQQADNANSEDGSSHIARDNFFDSSSPSRGNVLHTLPGFADDANDSLSYISTGRGEGTRDKKKRGSESSASHAETVPNPFYDIDKAHEERQLRESEELLAQDSMADAHPSVEMSPVRSISQVDGADDSSSSSSSPSSPSSSPSPSLSSSLLFSTARTNRSEDQSHSHDAADTLSRDPVDEIQESVLAAPEPQTQVSVVVDLTVSSPPQSPSGSDDEDYAKKHRLPRGSGWVQKAEEPSSSSPPPSLSTRRRTRSAANSQVLQTLKEVSISPPQRKTATRRRRGGSSWS